MSTFDGKVKEFPDIRIDHFRLSNESTRPPLAYFLSHVHSDHLQGLESCKSPFIYCSPATREILLRLEKYPHRMNFAKGILETRQQTYRHMKKLLKTIPLETPTVIDLAPEKSIRVTLFDANHCIGAVMFLIEGDGKAVLYTGDIRSELWWVNTLKRHPLLLPYMCDGSGRKPLKQLDCIYLDTTFATKANPYKHFPSKAEGTLELLQKVAKYPKDTVFYFDTWTFGYEDVWLALCGFLNCQVHVDDYRYKLYRALATGDEPRAPEAARLFGYQCGNHTKEGCLTTRHTRLHSCEQGTGCAVFSKDFVRITPIISRHEGEEIAELGAGGGKGDLDQQHELEVGDISDLKSLVSLCVTKLREKPQLRESVVKMLGYMAARSQVNAIKLDPSALLSEASGLHKEDLTALENLPIDSLVDALIAMASKEQEDKLDVETNPANSSEHRSSSSVLPKRITFPYSRHSSYTELCHLIEAFKPKYIWPCTVEKANWSASQSMGFLFGHLYDSSCKFAHDQEMLRGIKDRGLDVTRSKDGPLDADFKRDDGKFSSGEARETGEKRAHVSDQLAGGYTETSGSRAAGSETPRKEFSKTRACSAGHEALQSSQPTRPQPPQSTNAPKTIEPANTYANFRKRRHQSEEDDEDGGEPKDHSTPNKTPPPLSPSEYTTAWQREAFSAALGTSSIDWSDIRLVSVEGHQEREEEL